MSSSYVPERGDAIWIDFNPQLGHEQRGRRPALVISHRNYNEKVGLALLCPITSKVKNHPFEVPLATVNLKGVVLSDQVKSLDWTVRDTAFIEKVDQQTLSQVIERIEVLIS